MEIIAEYLPRIKQDIKDLNFKKESQIDIVKMIIKKILKFYKNLENKRNKIKEINDINMSEPLPM